MGFQFGGASASVDPVLLAKRRSTITNMTKDDEAQAHHLAEGLVLSHNEKDRMTFIRLTEVETLQTGPGYVTPDGSIVAHFGDALDLWSERG